MPRTRRVIVAALACLLVTAPATAGAADGLQVSADGHTWGDQLADPLFAPHRRWIPGESVISDVAVRQGGAQSAAVAVRAQLTGDAELIGPSGLKVSARLPGQDWQDLPPCVAVPITDLLPRDQAASIQIRVLLPWSAPNSTRNRTAELGLTVLAVDAAAGPTDARRGCADGGDPISSPGPGAEPSSGSPETSIPASPGTGSLPDTGSGTAPWLGLIGMLALVGGVVVLRGRRQP